MRNVHVWKRHALFDPGGTIILTPPATTEGPSSEAGIYDRLLHEGGPGG